MRTPNSDQLASARERAPAPGRAETHTRAKSRHAGVYLMLLAFASGCAGGKAASGSRPMLAPPAADVVLGALERFEMPFYFLDARGGSEVDREAFRRKLDGARAICVGESHDNPHHHFAQFVILDALTRTATRAASTALGLEMFQLPFQGVLDDFFSGRIDHAALLTRTGWEDRWGYDFEWYRPMIDLAKNRKLAALLALNTPSELAKKVARQGLEALSPEEKAALPELDHMNAEHRRYFKEATSGLDQHVGDMESFYSAQVVRDEMMADAAARWLNADPARRIVILSGTGHCHPTAVPARIRRRGVTEVLSVQPVLDGGGRVAEALASPEADLLFVMTSEGRNPHEEPLPEGHPAPTAQR